MALELRENSIYTDKEISVELEINLEELRKFLEENSVTTRAAKIGDTWIVHSGALKYHFTLQK